MVCFDVEDALNRLKKPKTAPKVSFLGIENGLRPINTGVSSYENRSEFEGVRALIHCCRQEI